MIAQANSFKMPLADNSVHCAITSIPYFNLRDYSLKPILFSDGFLGSYGLEPTIGLFVQHTVEVCREIKRVLRPDGVFWLNIGDSFATGKNGRSAADGKALGSDNRTFRDKPFSITEVPAKNLCLIPQRVVIALQEDGWIVRSAPVWVKRNPLPESVRDRPGTAHEYIYMLVKSARYWWDGEAVRRGYSRLWDDKNIGKNNRVNTGELEGTVLGRESDPHCGLAKALPNASGRALRTSDFFFDSLDAAIVHLTAIRDSGGLLLDSDGGPGAFVVNPKGFAGAHYATFPLALVEPMIKASAPDKCCPKCGKGWVRVVEVVGKLPPQKWEKIKKETGDNYSVGPMDRGGNGQYQTGGIVTGEYLDKRSIGFRPGCACMREAAPNFGMRGDELLELFDEKAREFAPVPGVILDPFCGSGTVGQAARELGRRFIGLDLSPKYLQENALPRSEKLTSTAVLATLPLFADMEF